MLRFVLVRGWLGHKKLDVLVSTDLSLSAEQIIELYCKRWSLEETFEWVKVRGVLLHFLLSEDRWSVRSIKI